MLASLIGVCENRICEIGHGVILELRTPYTIRGTTSSI